MPGTSVARCSERKQKEERLYGLCDTPTDVQRCCCPHTRRGMCLRHSKLYNNNLSSDAGWHRPSCLLPSTKCLRYSASVVYISGCSEGKTNGILHKYPSSSTLRGSLPPVHFPQLPNGLRSRFLVRRVRLFLIRNHPCCPRRDSILARGCFILGKTERGNGFGERDEHTFKRFRWSFGNREIGKSCPSDCLA